MESFKNTNNNLSEDTKIPQISESFILSDLLNKFESMNLLSKLAFSLLILKSALIFALISIVFVFLRRDLNQ